MWFCGRGVTQGVEVWIAKGRGKNTPMRRDNKPNTGKNRNVTGTSIYGL